MSTELIVNKHSNVLIIGEGKTNYGLKEVNYETDYDFVVSKYGDSELSESFKIVKDMGIEDIFLLNLRNKNDYLDVIELLKQNDFAYIVCTNLFLSDTFADFYEPEYIHSYYAYILGSIGRDSDSVFIVTDKHASLFENIDSFNEFMNESVFRFKNRCSIKANLENIIVVGNNLKDVKLANVVLAGALASTKIPHYPVFDFGKAIFHIDKFDNPYDYAYFANHSNRETTIENLVNCSDNNARKIVSINRIVKYIKRSIDISEFSGKLYNPYHKMQIQNKVELYMKKFLDMGIIKDYRIISIELFKSMQGAIDVLCNIEIVPYNSFEVCSLELGVTV